jgi:branched-chain amino acid transport system permease protein
MFGQIILNGLIAGGIYSLMAVGFQLVYGNTRFFHFAHAAVYAFGAYFAFFFFIQSGLDRFSAFALACLLAGMLGIGMELGVYRPMRRAKATDLTLLIASLGLYTVLQNVISLLWGDQTQTMRTGDVKEGIEVLGARITEVQILIIIVSVVLITVISQMMTRMKWGKALRAVANDSELARLSGISTDRYILVAFGVGSFLAAVAAILISFDTDMTPTMGFNALVKGVIAVIIGGMSSLPGAAVGGLLLGMAENLGVWWLPTKWQDSIAFGVLILFLLFRPYGILGKKPTKHSA